MRDKLPASPEWLRSERSVTTYTFSDPEAAVVGFFESRADLLPTGTTVSTAVPDAAITVPHVQIGWDGTPSDGVNREPAVIRCTAWAPQGQVTVAKNLGSLARAMLLQFGSASVWRTYRGAGRAIGTDPDLGLPFCTFTVTAEMRPESAVSL